MPGAAIKSHWMAGNFAPPVVANLVATLVLKPLFTATVGLKAALTGTVNLTKSIVGTFKINKD